MKTPTSFFIFFVLKITRQVHSLPDFFRLGDLEVISKKRVVENDLRSLWVMQMSEIFSDLTERQMRYFSDALTAGYFNIPKRTTIDQLARMNNLSTATMQEHLSKAESKILTSLDNYLKFYHRYMEKSP
jgi:Predicted DNA binding protein